MLRVCVPKDEPALGVILEAAMVRSFSRSQVERVEGADLERLSVAAEDILLVVANPADDWAPALNRLLAQHGTKLAVFGRVGPSVARLLGIETEPLQPSLEAHSRCAPASVGHASASELCIQYLEDALARSSPVRLRPFRRHDFAEEWNNLGFGAISCNGSSWSLAQLAHARAARVLAEVRYRSRSVSAFTTLVDGLSSSALWINRAVGTIDSQEWRLVESYFTSHRESMLACLPMLLECPFGFDAAVTMRLDCDEDLATAAPLFARYRALGVPLSLAIKSDLLANPGHRPLINDVLRSGGSLLSHSASHPANWGPDYAHALDEASRSAAEIGGVAGDARTVRYAVSPFHQNPQYAVRALADAGYDGFIGGIIANDPEYLVARGGEVPGGRDGFITHSQQCMLHGDCVPAEADPIAAYLESFRLARGARSIFAYLDHPFSPRYQYGWRDEAQRSDIHEALIASIRASGKVLFLSENAALDFVRARATARLERADDGTIRAHASHDLLAVEYRGRVSSAKELVA